MLQPINNVSSPNFKAVLLDKNLSEKQRSIALNLKSCVYSEAFADKKGKTLADMLAKQDADVVLRPGQGNGTVRAYYASSDIVNEGKLCECHYIGDFSKEGIKVFGETLKSEIEETNKKVKAFYTILAIGVATGILALGALFSAGKVKLSDKILPVKENLELVKSSTVQKPIKPAFKMFS